MTTNSATYAATVEARTVRPSDVEAANSVEPATLAALVDAVRTIVAAGSAQGADDVEAVASLRVASFWVGLADDDADPAARVRWAARSAVRAARRHLAAGDGSTSLDALVDGGWEPDHRTDVSTSAYRPATTRPESVVLARFGGLPAYVEQTARLAGLAPALVVLLVTSATEYLAHLAGTCAVCPTDDDGHVTRAARRPSLSSILAHLAGEASSSSLGKATDRAWSAYRAALGADGLAALADLFTDVEHGTSKSSVTMVTPTGHTDVMRLACALIADGQDTRGVTLAESATIALPSPERARMTAYAGESDPRVDRENTGTPAAWSTDRLRNGQVRSFKAQTTPSPRKRASGNGPSIPATF